MFCNVMIIYFKNYMLKYIKLISLLNMPYRLRVHLICVCAFYAIKYSNYKKRSYTTLSLSPSLFPTAHSLSICTCVYKERETFIWCLLLSRILPLDNDFLSDTPNAHTWNRTTPATPIYTCNTSLFFSPLSIFLIRFSDIYLSSYLLINLRLTCSH